MIKTVWLNLKIIWNLLMILFLKKKLKNRKTIEQIFTLNKTSNTNHIQVK